jgi:MFS transporter, ACS family, DAL5 transporter family protein
MKDEIPVLLRESSARESAITDNTIDNALNFLRQNDRLSYSFSENEERKLVSKIDWMLMPFMATIYMLQYLDKTISNILAPTEFSDFRHR